MDGAREGGALGEHGETVAQIGHVVLGLHFVSVKRFVTLVMNDTELDQPLSQFSAKHACMSAILVVYLSGGPCDKRDATSRLLTWRT